MMTLGPLSTILLIFGGCCSNVFTLEAIIRTRSSGGLLITFFQFLFTALAAYPSRLSTSTTARKSSFGLRAPRVPVAKWAVIATLHFSINMLNNWAFAYNISVPVHIILRSFGSVTTMLAGMLRGKRYSVLQIVSVMLLTAGVLMSAWADSERKGTPKATRSDSSSKNAPITHGLAILLVAQLVSAYMGAYVEDVYAAYGADWTENLFYAHALSLPLFLPLSPILRSQFEGFTDTPPLSRQSLLSAWKYASGQGAETYVPDGLLQAIESVPLGLILLVLNAVTQLACISGVNLLSAKSSAVTVTIVLNVRKLVSFIFSTILFSHQLSEKMVLGSVLVFGSGALYSYETSWRIPSRRKRQAHANGTVHKRA